MSSKMLVALVSAVHFAAFLPPCAALCLCAWLVLAPHLRPLCPSHGEMRLLAAYGVRSV